MGKMKTSEELSEWEYRRTKTFIGFICQAVGLGMEYSLTFITLWSYLEEMRTDHIKLYYSLISAAYLLSQVVTSIILGHVADKYRNIKELCICGNILVVIGNILYTIPLSPLYLFAGRLVSGGGGCLRCIMTGELARSYPNEELSKKFSLMGMAFGLGFIVGPGINFGFLHANFWIGPIHVFYANAPGFYLAIVFMLLELFAAIMVSNLSKEYDLKSNTFELHYLEHNDEEVLEDARLLNGDMNNDDINSRKIVVGQRLSALAVIGEMFKNIDTALVLVFSFFFMYCMVSFDLWQPLAVLKLNNWGVFEINLIIFGYGVLTVFVLLTLSYFPMGDKTIVYFSMICTFSISAINVIFIIFVQINNPVLNIILWVLFDLFFAIIVVMEEVFLIGVMARMTSSVHQSFVESLRLGFSRSGALFALLSAASSFTNLNTVCATLAGCGFTGILVLCFRRRSLQNPEILIK